MSNSGNLKDSEYKDWEYMEEIEGIMEKEKQQTNKSKYIGSTGFIITVTALISIAATLLAISFINGGVVFLKHSRYGDLSAVIPVSEVLYNIDSVYYSENGKTPSKDELVVAAMKGMVYSLGDPYAQYFTKEEFEEYRKAVGSSFKGIGIVIYAPDENGSLITKVHENSPAEKAGLQAGDIITAVNGQNVCGTDLSFLDGLIQGKDGEAVVLTITRNGEEMEITAYYGDVTVKTVTGRMQTQNTGYIAISQFADNTAAEFETELEKLQKKNIKSLIIDLRNNPGGYLDSVLAVADTIIDSGTIVSIGNTLDDPNLEVYTAKKGGLSCKIVVLINENSASASEILAAAIKENGVGTLVGITTYGKGIVQSTGQLYSTDGYLKLTTAAYYTPSGNNIHNKGVAPDIEVDIDSSLKMFELSTLPIEQDTQLQKALAFLGESYADGD